MNNLVTINTSGTDKEEKWGNGCSEIERIQTKELIN